MSSMESLPPDQRAVLALVLQRGRSYDEIATLLAIDRAAVRDRALAALDALGPAETSVPLERRALITDYLLGQLPEAVNEQTRERLGSSPSERAWARVLASELAPLAAKPLPEIPSGPVSVPVEPEPVPEPAAPEPEPAALEPTTAPELGATPAGSAAGAPAPSGSSGRMPKPTPGARSSSRGGGGILLAIAALVVVVVVIIILVNNGSSSPKKAKTTKAANTPTTTTTTSTPSTTGTTTTPSEHIIAQIGLRPAKASSKATGEADVVTVGNVTGVVVAATHLTPNSAHNAYAVWLSNPGGPSKLLGYVSPSVGKSGDMKTTGPLPSNASSYKEILITLETTEDTTTPGPTVLSGALSLKSG
jgi:hypothetical protein